MVWHPLSQVRFLSMTSQSVRCRIGGRLSGCSFVKAVTAIRSCRLPYLLVVGRSSEKAAHLVFRSSKRTSLCS